MNRRKCCGNSDSGRSLFGDCKNKSAEPCGYKQGESALSDYRENKTCISRRNMDIYRRNLRTILCKGISDYAAYIDNPDKTIYLAYSGSECIGQIVLRKDWNRYAFIEDICVAQSARGQGVGTGLIQKAVQWAEDSGMKGLALETQDNNLLACRFYAKCGFVIGAVNTMLYRNFDNEESAVFWYLRNT